MITPRMEQWISITTLLIKLKLEHGGPAGLFLVRSIYLYSLIIYHLQKLWGFALIFQRAGTEGCERLAYYGMSTNLVNYLRQQLNQNNVTASKTVTNWQGTCYVTPLLGAFLADSYLGRYRTIACFSTLYVFVSNSLFSFLSLFSSITVTVGIILSLGANFPDKYREWLC